MIDAGLYRRLFAELAAIGREPGGWNRMAWGPGEDAARDWFRATAAALGLELVQDPAGNLWAVEPGGGRAVRRRRLARRLGGRRRRVRRRARRRRGPRRGRGGAPRGGAPRPLAVGAMVDEEGPRFGAAIFGSRALSGRARHRRRARAHRSRGQRHARSGGPARRDRRDAARRARLPAARRLVDRGARRAGPGARRRSCCARRRDLAGRARALALHAARRVRPRRHGRDGRAGATRSCPPRAPSSPRTTSPSPSRVPSRRSGASARCRDRPTRCRVRRA